MRTALSRKEGKSSAHGDGVTTRDQLAVGLFYDGTSQQSKQLPTYSVWLSVEDRLLGHCCDLCSGHKVTEAARSHQQLGHHHSVLKCSEYDTWYFYGLASTNLLNVM